MTVSIAQAKARLSELLQAAERGEPVTWRQLGDVTSRAGVPCRQSKPGHRATNGSDRSEKWPRHITRHGRPVVDLISAAVPKPPVPLASLKRFRASMPLLPVSSAEIVRRLRMEED